jgi:hypothetical protein
MFGRETRMLLRHHLEQGTSKSALARQLGVYRDTIHRSIRAGELDRELSAVRLLAQIRAAGYPQQLKAFVRQVRPAPAPESVVCFENASRQAGAGGLRAIHVSLQRALRVLVVLGYSRLLWCRFYPRQACARRPAGLRRRSAISAACRRICSSIR